MAVTCRYCKKTDSARWYYVDICRSCRRKQLRGTLDDEGRVIVKNKEKKQCLECGKTKSPRWAKKGTQCNICYNKEYRIKNKKILRKKAKEYRLNNKEKINECKRRYRAKTGKHKKAVAARKALKRASMPKWICKKEILNIYKNCPKGMTVDHIIPLKNDLVCGLHVPSNLRYLSVSDNCKKWNKFDGTYENESWKKCQ